MDDAQKLAERIERDWSSQRTVTTDDIADLIRAHTDSAIAAAVGAALENFWLTARLAWPAGHDADYDAFAKYAPDTHALTRLQLEARIGLLTEMYKWGVHVAPSTLDKMLVEARARMADLVREGM